MRIGILTHHYINNFGAFLQAYSLQQAIKELHPEADVYIINCVNIKHFIINTGGWFRFYRKKENIACWMQKIKLPWTFSRARKKYMNLTKTCYDARGIEKLKLNYIVVGSDEVWNYCETKGNAKVKFGIGLNKEKLIAYAPSVGETKENDIPDYVIKGIKRFKAVSARDYLTEKLVEKIREEEIERVVDPTFLAKIPDESVKGINRPYILFYYCDGLKEEEKEKIFAYAKNKKMDIYGAGECDKKYSDITVNLTPFQWVWMFRNAEYVITGTFHGAVFSMLNHRQFACYLTNPSRIEKVGSLLKEFDLDEKQTNGTAEELIKQLEKRIDYDVVEIKFDAGREKSRKFLVDNIT